MESARLCYCHGRVSILLTNKDLQLGKYGLVKTKLKSATHDNTHLMPQKKILDQHLQKKIQMQTECTNL